MKVRFHEIEFGVEDTDRSANFYSNILGLKESVNLPKLKVFRTGNPGLDLNVSKHVSPKTTVISFLTDDIQEVIKKLQRENIIFRGPEESHLGMRAIEFTDPDGVIVRVNQTGKDSPEWLSI
ncbi:VOC family protein [Daejeonella lutea]|uniref:VOC domain-containing protein n=1 Tax=Daejeonella lutea TaxID=572036 RepID=A0A1T5A967_9SPHI|nr:VOC family protein [Daejeonella lutea]SKB31455.1 hypothetical protein SAMN05661099_0474 [Daejeonella lutea]